MPTGAKSQRKKSPELLASPTFGERTNLVRRIDPEHQLPGRYIDSAAFYADLGPPRETYLSVNSTEIQKVRDIARRYAGTSNMASVAVGIFQIAVSNEAAKDSGVVVAKHSEFAWSFDDSGRAAPAYHHRGYSGNSSHCGIEFIRVMDDDTESRFARRMAKRRRYQLVDL
jgi:hypothetical protein